MKTPRSKPLLPLFLLLAGCATPEPGPVAPGVQVTYIANEGYLLEAGEDSVLVDALFGNETVDWCHVPPPETLARMESAQPPFDGVDLVLVTHAHVDHFAPGRVLRHLEANPDAMLVVPPQGLEPLTEEPAWSEEYHDRIEVLDLELFESSRLTVRGIELEVHRVRHCYYPETDPATGETRSRHERVEQLVYAFDVGDLTVLHLGDSIIAENREYFEGPRFEPGEIDLVFMEGWSPESLEILQAELAPRHVVFMHLPAEPELIERLAEALTAGVPGSVVFRKPLETRCFE